MKKKSVSAVLIKHFYSQVNPKTAAGESQFDPPVVFRKMYHHKSHLF